MSEVPGPGEDGLDAKLIRLPRRPRRMMQDSGERSRKSRRPGSAGFDLPPTRPVLRSELQRETGAMPVDIGPAWECTPNDGPRAGRHEAAGSVTELGAPRRKREPAPTAELPRVPKPRRVDSE